MFYFEDGATGKGDLVAQMQKQGRNADLRFLRKFDHPALEAADFAAWEVTSFFRQAIRLQPTYDLNVLKYRKSYEALRQTVPNKEVVMDEKELISHCIFQHVPNRK